MVGRKVVGDVSSGFGFWGRECVRKEGEREGGRRWWRW